MAIIRIEHGCAIVVGLDQGIQAFGFLECDEVKSKPEMTGLRLFRLKKCNLLIGYGEIEATRLVYSAGDTGFLFNLPIEIDSVLLKGGDIRIAIKGMHSPGCVPCRPGGQSAR